MGHSFDTTLLRPVLDGREQRIAGLFESDDVSDPDSLVARFVDELAGEPPSETMLAHIARALDRREMDDRVRITLWQTLLVYFPGQAHVRAHLGDALHGAGYLAEAVEAFLGAFELAPALVDDFDSARDAARAMGGDAWLHYQIAELSAALDAALAAFDGGDPGADSDAPTDSDEDEPDAPDPEIRERYSELLAECRDSDTAMARLRAVGRRITELEEAGVLPQSMVLRGAWRGK